ncbi:glycerate kinase [Caldilinea sp.]|uniref:glycerate kinase type-2 family protein n=1 Tax=Caldilinea sp. TaxID=2293560 RepID=UPI002C6F1B89|nr:glycerate kinase [Anaerolineales bacterium]HQY90118.1 glycerate kinase [Caldilinea sp.]HRA65935.1 glycerate kinase [Caldilinea sp.]
MTFDPLILLRNTEARHRYLDIMQAALDAVDPYRAVREQMRVEAGTLWVGDRSYRLARFRRILVVGAGKAGAPMARAVEDVLGDALAGGLVIVKSGHAAPTVRIELVEASHPIPDQVGVAAGQRMLAQVEAAGADDLVLTLLSGGGSALLEAPAGITLAELQAMTDALLACGATINEINCLRKHVSRVKGGQLARAASPATLVTLVLSDVVGSPLDVIASGPTVPDSTTWADAWAVVERYKLQERLPVAVLARLTAGRQGQLPDTPKPGDPLFVGAHTCVVGDNRVAALAACRRAEALGYRTLLLTSFVEGEAAEVAKVAVAVAREVRASGHPLAAPACLVLGGETTVTLGDAPGRGGRNQELALAASRLLDGMAGVTVASLATDGSDGPTDSAGGLVDGETIMRGRAGGLDADAALRRHDAYPSLRATGDLLLTGPTQTNVNDLIFVWVE